MTYPITPAPLSLGVTISLGSDPAQSLRTVRDLGLAHAQVFYAASWDTEEGRALVRRSAEENGIALTSFIGSFEGESYADIAAVDATVGLVPLATREARLAFIEQLSLCAHALEVTRVNTHIGFIPEDASHEQYPVLVEMTRGICARLGERGQTFALETGQETAATLQRFIADVGAPNLSVNFDPANMIMYANDAPVAATQALAPWIGSVHCKDGLPPAAYGQLGHEVPFGEGHVDVPRWLAALLATGYRGPLTIEREVHGEEQRAGIVQARQLLESLLPTLLAPSSQA